MLTTCARTKFDLFLFLILGTFFFNTYPREFLADFLEVSALLKYIWQLGTNILYVKDANLMKVNLKTKNFCSSCELICLCSILAFAFVMSSYLQIFSEVSNTTLFYSFVVSY